MSENKSTKLDPQQDYDSFCILSIAEGDSLHSLPSYDDWIEIREHMSSKDNMLAFVNNPGLGPTLVGTAAKVMGNPMLRRMVNDGVDSISRRGTAAAQKVAQDLASGTPFAKVKLDFGDTGGDSGDKAGGSGSPANPFNPGRQNFNPKPVQVRLDTGLKPKTYGEYYPVSSDNQSILDLTMVQFTVPTSTVSVLKSYFDTVITFNFQNDAQMRVSFNVDAINKFSANNLRDWMNRYASAYSLYVFFTSVIGYCNEPLQQNEGMRALRAMMTPTLLDDLSQLENMLDGTPAPPKFRELLHFIYGAPFKTSANPGSSVRMIMPCVLLAGTTPFGSPGLTSFAPSVLQNAITELFNMRETTALIARVCPTWLPGRGNTSGGMAVCEYSHNWHTLFENLPFADYKNGTDHRGPIALTENADVLYSATGDILDGAITALATMYNTAGGSFNNNWTPGTMFPLQCGPVAFNFSNRVSYVNNTIESFFSIAPNLTNSKNYSRCETYTVASAVHGIIWPGREKINNVNIASSRQTAYELFSLIFDLGDIPNNRSGGNKYNSRRRGKKSKSKDDMNKED